MTFDNDDDDVDNDNNDNKSNISQLSLKWKKTHIYILFYRKIGK